MKYLLDGRFYNRIGFADAMYEFSGPVAKRGPMTFVLKYDVHEWLVEQGISYKLEAEHINIEETRSPDGAMLKIIKHTIGDNIYIDMDEDFLVLFKLTWG